MVFWLGFLPGGGSLYHGNYSDGVVGILTWPFSIIWETNIGWDTAKYTDFRVTKDYLESQKVIEIEKIDLDFNQNNVSAEEYLVFKDKIINKYDYK